MSYDLVVRGGTIVTATDRFAGDVGIRGGRIVAIGDGLPRGAEEIDARGLQVLPGGVDVHTHLDIDLGGMRSVDDFESGTAAAAVGGITTICDYAWQHAGWTLARTVEEWKARAAGRAHVDYGFHVVVNDASDGPARRDPAPGRGGLPEPQGVHDQGVRDQRRRRCSGSCGPPGEAGAVVNVHAENSEMLDLAAADMIAAGRWDPRHYAESRPALAEAEATRRAIDYAELTDAEIYVVHMSCREAVEAVRTARQRGLRVWGETRPIYLGLTQERYEAGGVEAAKVVGAPPLRTAEDQAALWDALRTGRHPGHRQRQLLLDGRAEGGGSRRLPQGALRRPRPGDRDARRLLGGRRPRAASPSRRSWRRSPRTPPGSSGSTRGRAPSPSGATPTSSSSIRPSTERIDARRLHSRAGYDPFEGFDVTGVPVLTVARGEIVAREGQLLSRPGRGQHLLRERAR